MPSLKSICRILAIFFGKLTSGIYEALELRDGGSDYLGKGVLKAVNNVNSIIGPAIIGKDPTEQVDIDNFMVQQLDGTSNEWGWCKQKVSWI
jgi:enolase